MARPVKKGLDYIPLDTHFFSNYKIMDLLNEYGPAGIVIYLYAILTIYQQGYYLAIPLDKLTVQTVHTIGAKWVKKSLVQRVIYYCAEIGLFNKSLLLQNIITSVGIQRRYAKVTVRNKVDKSKFWLLDDEALEGVPQADVSATKNEVIVTETPVNGEKIPTNKIKEKEVKKEKYIKENQPVEAEVQKTKYADFVSMTEDEHRDLIGKYGDKKVARMIEVLNNHKGANGKTYQNDYYAILSWVAEKVDKEFEAKPKDVSFDVELAMKTAREHPKDFSLKRNTPRRR